MPELDTLLGPVRLLVGPLGVAEDHSKGDGRRFAMDQIRAGRVRALFLEVKSYQQESFDKRTEEEEFYFHHAPWAKGQPIYLEEVANVAVAKRVPVFFLDIPAQDLRLKKGTDGTAPVVQARDKHAANLFQKIVGEKLNGSMMGCLVLYGKSHFTGMSQEYPGMERDGWKKGVKQECLADYLQLDYILFD